MKKKLSLSVLLAVSVTAAIAGPIEDQIKTRQSAYTFIAAIPNLKP
jgi:hypothetical protein